MANEPIVILHGWSDGAPSFKRLAEFLKEELNRDVESILLADWLSMNDEIT